MCRAALSSDDLRRESRKSMSHRSVPKHAIVAFAVVAAMTVPVTALSASHQTSYAARPSTASGFMTRDAASGAVPILFVSDLITNAVWLFNANDLSQPPIGEVTQGISSPFGMGVDGAGNLYVNTSGKIEVYAPGALSPTRTVDASGFAISVAVAKDGTLATFTERTGSPFGHLLIFDKGSMTPTRKIGFAL